MNDYESEALICMLALVILWSKAYNIGIGREPSVPDASFTIYRVESIQWVSETAKLMVDAGMIVLVSFISPFRSEREMARLMVEDGEFLEVFIDTPLEVCERRHVKGLYEKARAVNSKILRGLILPMNVRTTQK